MSSTPEKFDLSALLDVHTRAIFGRLHTGLVARVISYNVDAQTVDAQPVTRQLYNDGTVERIEPIRKIPVQHEAGAGFCLSYPLEDGDFVFLSFSERSIDEWKARAESDYDPFLKHRFSLSDAIAIPITSPARPLKSARADALVIGEDDPATGMRIEISADHRIKIGTPQVELLSMLDSFLGALDTFLAATSIAVMEPTLGPASIALKAQAAIIRTAIQSIKGA